MKLNLIILASAVTFTASGAAQAQDAATPTYDCALFNECGPTAGGARAPATNGRKSETRGWNLSRTLPSTAAKPVPGKPASSAVVGRRPVAATVAASRKPRLAPAAAPTQAASRVKLAQGITFVTGSANLTPSAMQNIDQLAAAMKRPDKMTSRFRIEGNTDSVGTRESNLELSKRRANSVSAYLVSKGVESSRLEVVGYGFDNGLPGLPGNSAANRRVEAKPIG
jgi:OmpA-OmpF porin, OOP family